MKNEDVKKIADLIATECIGVRVRLLNRVVTALYDESLRPLGMTLNQLNLLVAIKKMEPVTAKQLGKKLQMETSTVSRNLDRMRKEGWLDASPGTDARFVYLRVSSSGARVIQKALPIWQKTQSLAKKTLGKNNIEALFQSSSIV